ncbi:unnamed protein product, partial [Rotaria magnacalcarata]
MSKKDPNPNIMPIPSGEQLNIFNRMLRECAKLQNTNAPFILMYKKDNLSQIQIDNLYRLSDKIPNFFIIDFETYIKNILEHPSTKECEKEYLTESIRRNETGDIRGGSNPARGSITDLNEIVQIYSTKFPNLPKEIALNDIRYRDDKLKREILEKSPNNQLIKRDPDTILRVNEMPEIYQHNTVKLMYQRYRLEDPFMGISNKDTELSKEIFNYMEEEYSQNREDFVNCNQGIFKFFNEALNRYQEKNNKYDLIMDAEETSNLILNMDDRIAPGDIE